MEKEKAKEAMDAPDSNESYKIAQEERDSWFQYRRGLRPEDRPFYDEVFDASSQMPDSFLGTRLLASEGIFLASALAREQQLHDLRKRVEALETIKHEQ